MAKREDRFVSMRRLSVGLGVLACAAGLAAGALADVRIASLTFEVSVDPPHPQVGDRVSVVFDVSADGVAGLQHYQLSGAGDVLEGVLEPATHATYFPDRVVFELTAVRNGTVDLVLDVNFEAQHCDGDNCYYAFRNQASSPVRIMVGGGGDLPDLVPTSIGLTDPIPSCPPTGIYFCIENRGGASARAFQVLLHVVGGESLARFFPEVGPAEKACVGIQSVGELGGIVPEDGGGQLEVLVDAMDEVAESDEGNNRSVFDIPELTPAGGCPTPTPTPSAHLRIDPPTDTLLCAGSFEASIVAEGAPGESVSIAAISFHHEYSEGFYGTGFTGDVSSITLPVELQNGDRLTIPISYHPQEFASLLHFTVIGTAPNGAGVAAGADYYGLRCVTPPLISTPTPTPTPTPLPAGDLGDVEVRGVVYDAVAGRDAPIGAAEITFRIPVQAPSYGETLADSGGRFTFRQRLHEGDRLEVRVDAPGYLTRTVSFSAGALPDPIEIGLRPLPGDEAVDSCALDCNQDSTVDIAELVTGVKIALDNSSLARCAAADTDGDHRVSIAEIVAGVDSALRGCPHAASNIEARLADAGDN